MRWGPARCKMSSLRIDPANYPGGIALWGALPAVYDTTKYPLESGVHVHARAVPNGNKLEDGSFDEVEVVDGSVLGGSVLVSRLAAAAYVASSIFGLKSKSLDCPSCHAPHLDVALCVHPHDKHCCANCGESFTDSEQAVANPVCAARAVFGDVAQTRPTTIPTRSIAVRQDQQYCSGGIRIWGSNRALLWTAPRLEEEGIHLHCYEEGNSNPTVDQTYGKVSIDGVDLDPRSVRNYMVQNYLSFLQGSLDSIDCPICEEPHEDPIVPHVVTPHVDHMCAACNHVMTSSRPIIANPLVKKIAQLYTRAQSFGFSKNPNKA